MIKVTCSILCYNYGQYLAQAIESCLEQEKGDYDLEIIVIDDGSTDNTPEVCNYYSKFVKCYVSKNEGFTSSLTKAVKYASGEIICLLDADDYFLPNKINQVVKAFKKKDDLLFLFHDKATVDEKGILIKQYDKGGNTSTQAFRKDAAIDLLPAVNEQFFYTLFLAGRGFHLKENLSHYRIHNLSMSRFESIFNWKKTLLVMNIFHLIKIKSLIKSPPAWAKESMMTTVYTEIASNYNFIGMEMALNNNKFSTAFRYYLRILYWDIVRRKKIKLKNLKLLLTYFLLRRYIRYNV